MSLILEIQFKFLVHIYLEHTYYKIKVKSLIFNFFLMISILFLIKKNIESKEFVSFNKIIFCVFIFNCNFKILKF